jgi:EAL and modified HD-GYP domain-containing signal transduction protein
MQLPENLKSTLRGEHSEYSDYLQLALACEDPALDDVPRLCGLLELDSAQFNSAHTSALAWIEELGL